MNEFYWSTAALNVNNRFYDKDFVVYVEGQEDVPFWDFIFNKFTDKTYQIKPVFGKTILKKLLHDKVGELNYLIAMDSDYDQLVGILDNKQALLTYGYSIENTFLTPSVIQEVIINYSKVERRIIDIQIVKDWIHKFETIVENLLAADLLNKEEKITPEQVIPNNFGQFSEKGSKFPIKNKIDEHLIKHGFTLNELNCREQIKKFSVMEIMKGHFVSSSVQNFVRIFAHEIASAVNDMKKKPFSISNESFYSDCLGNFKRDFDREHPHFSYYKKMVSYHLDKLS